MSQALARFTIQKDLTLAQERMRQRLAEKCNAFRPSPAHHCHDRDRLRVDLIRFVVAQLPETADQLGKLTDVVLLKKADAALMQRASRQTIRVVA